MIKKIFSMILILLASLLTVSCQKTDLDAIEARLAAKYKGIPLGELPSGEEFERLPRGERIYLQKVVAAIPEDEAKAFLAEEIEAFCKDSTLVAFKDVIVKRDELYVIPKVNHKAVEDLKLTIQLELLSLDDLNPFKAASDFAHTLEDHLDGLPYVRLLMKECHTEIHRNGVVTDHWDTSISFRQNAYVEQTDLEYEAQTLAFKFFKRNHRFVLQRFGAIPETKELYIEYAVDDKYFGMTREENEKKIEKLEDVWKKIEAQVLDKKATREYMKEQQLTTCTVVFKNLLLEDGQMVFQEELEQPAR